MFHIMVVDDEITSQEIIRKYIEVHLPEYHVQHICSNGPQALKCFEESPSDIVLVDIHMPIMSGIELIEQLKKRSEDFIPIIISGYAEFEYAKLAMELGVSHYLLKPLDFKELKRSILAATHTLTTKRKRKASLDWAEENQEIFFCQLLSNQYPTQKDALSSFLALRLPFAYETTGGLVIDIHVEPTDAPLYESDVLFGEIKQILQELYSAPYILMLTNQNSICRYLLTGNQLRSVCVQDVLCAAKNSLDIEISVTLEYPFASFEELRTSKLIPQLTEESLTKEDHRQNIAFLIENAVAYMAEHYAEDLTRETVAEKVYMSGAHFSRCFKMIMKTSYKDYLTELRMRKAIELLNTKAQIQDIARQVGYPNTNRFNINFKSYTSYTPSEYRRIVLKRYAD